MLRLLLLSSLLALGGSPGCIVAESPDYREPQMTRPNILADTANPPTQFPIVVNAPPPPNSPSTLSSIDVEVQSEDADERLVIAFYVDYGVRLATAPYRPFLDAFVQAPSTFAERKKISVDLNLGDPGFVPDGCHTLTMLVMHESSWDISQSAPYPDRLSADVSLINWVMYVNVPAGVAPTCPMRSSDTAP